MLFCFSFLCSSQELSVRGESVFVYRQILSWGKLVPAAHTGGSGAGWCLCNHRLWKQPNLQKSQWGTGKGLPYMWHILYSSLSILCCLRIGHTAEWPVLAACVWWETRINLLQFTPTKSPFRFPAWFQAVCWANTKRTEASSYLHPTDANAQRCRGALFTLLDVPGFLLLWSVIAVLPGSHL